MFLYRFGVLLCIVTVANKVNARIPVDVQIREPAQSKLSVETALNIFLLELLPFKAQFVLKNVRPNCSRALTPYIDSCYKDYELESKYALANRGTEKELRVGCCNLWQYHSCVVGAVELLAHYSYKACNEYDAEEAEQILEATEEHPKSRLMCADYHQQSFFCTEDKSFNKMLNEANWTLTMVLLLGLVAILVSALMAG